MVKNKGLTRSVSNPVPRSSIGSTSRIWLPGRRACKGRRKTPAPHGHPSPPHLSERDLTGAVRATAAITAAITQRSLARSLAQVRKGGPATPAPRVAPTRRMPLCQRLPPPPLSQPGVRLAAVSACSPGTATTSGFRSHLFFQSRPSRRLWAPRRRAADVNTRRPRSGPALGGAGGGGGRAHAHRASAPERGKPLRANCSSLAREAAAPFLLLVRFA